MKDTVLTLLRDKHYSELRDMLVEMYAADIASLLESLESRERALIFRLLGKDQAAEAFVELEPDTQEQLINDLSDSELSEGLDELSLDDAVDLVEEMPANVVRKILSNTNPETRNHINDMLKYPKDSVGSIMTIEYVSLKATMTVEDAFLRIKRTGIDKETVYTCYVKDAHAQLIGVVSVRTLLLAESDDIIADLMQTNIVSLSTLDDKEEAVLQFNRYNFLALPVVDREGRLVGIVTFDDAMDVMEEEATEDIEIMAGITPTDKPYLKTGVFETYTKRIPWLMLLMISATLTSRILNSFEDALAAQSALISFIPMISGTGGNAGSQSSVSVIRSLSLGELALRDILKVIWKEMRVSVVCGLSLAIVNFGKMLLIDPVTPMIAAVVCITLVFTVIVAKFVGCVLPLLVKTVGLDPAVMASPVITTCVDALSMLVYFQVAKVILNL